MSTDINPVPGTMVDLVQDLGERLLNLYITFDRGVGYHDAAELLDGLLDALVAQTEYVLGRAFTARRVTVQDVAAERLLNEVCRRLLREARFYTLFTDCGTDNVRLLRKVLAYVFDVSVTCVTGGAR